MPEETEAPAEQPAEPSKEAPKEAPEKAPAPEAKEAPKEPPAAPKAAVDYQTFDQGWNAAITQAAATVKAAVQLGQSSDNGPSAELVAEIVMGLKRVDTHLREEPVTHTLRSQEK